MEEEILKYSISLLDSEQKQELRPRFKKITQLTNNFIHEDLELTRDRLDS